MLLSRTAACSLVIDAANGESDTVSHAALNGVCRNHTRVSQCPTEMSWHQHVSDAARTPLLEHLRQSPSRHRHMSCMSW